MAKKDQSSATDAQQDAKQSLDEYAERQAAANAETERQAAEQDGTPADAGAPAEAGLLVEAADAEQQVLEAERDARVAEEEAVNAANLEAVRPAGDDSDKARRANAYVVQHGGFGQYARGERIERQALDDAQIERGLRKGAIAPAEDQ